MATKETWRWLAQILVDRGILVPVEEDLIPRTEDGDLILGGFCAKTSCADLSPHFQSQEQQCVTKHDHV